MAEYIIRVDSSTEPSGTTNYHGPLRQMKSGKSAAGWITRRENKIIAGGLIYYDYNGPNKVMYEGILAALSQLETTHFNLAGNDTIKVFTDIELVSQQINNKKRVEKMKKHLGRIKLFLKNHPNVYCEFLYQNDKDPEYKKAHNIATRGRVWIEQMLSN